MLTYDDFKNIGLSRKEFKALKKLSKLSTMAVDENIAKELLHTQLISKLTIGYDGDMFPIFEGMYTITDNGNRYFIFRKKQIFEFLLKSVLVPVVVAAITTLITIWLKELL